MKDFEKYMNRFKVEALVYIQNSAPVRTGALRSMIRLQNNADGGFSIISPISYMKYTEEPWRKDFTKDGRENPNLYWMKEATEDLVDKLRRDLND